MRFLQHAKPESKDLAVLEQESFQAPSTVDKRFSHGLEFCHFSAGWAPLRQTPAGSKEIL